MVLYVDEKTELRFKQHVLSSGYAHGDFSKKATEAIEFYLEHHEGEKTNE